LGLIQDFRFAAMYLGKAFDQCQPQAGSGGLAGRFITATAEGPRKSFFAAIFG
jgi:hypothetical protein